MLTGIFCDHWSSFFFTQFMLFRLSKQWIDLKLWFTQITILFGTNTSVFRWFNLFFHFTIYLTSKFFFSFLGSFICLPSELFNWEPSQTCPMRVKRGEQLKIKIEVEEERKCAQQNVERVWMSLMRRPEALIYSRGDTVCVTTQCVLFRCELDFVFKSLDFLNLTIDLNSRELKL